jgi:hypothetical protein
MNSNDNPNVPVIPGYPSPAETAAHWDRTFSPGGPVTERPWTSPGPPPWGTLTQDLGHTPRHRRPASLVFWILLASALMVLLAAAITVRNQNLLPAGVPVIGMDTGVAACKAISEGGKPATPGSVDKDQYRKLRQVFADSRYPAIRDNGVKVVDIGWQIQAIPQGQEIDALAYVGSFTSAYAGLSGGCAERGYTIPALMAD